MVRLLVLGSVGLHDDGGHELRPVIAQPKRLALLTFLALAPGGFARRDTLLAMFWPELDATRARDALSQALRFLRRHCGDTVIRTRGNDDVGVAGIDCDAAALAQAAEAGRYEEALRLYRGDLVPHLFTDASHAFEDWLDGERTRLRAIAARAARQLAEEREAAESFTTAVSCARRAAELSGDDERVLRDLIGMLDRLGDRAGALHAYQRFRERVAAEYDAEPSPETRALIRRIVARADIVAPAAAQGAEAAQSIPSAARLSAESSAYEILRELGRGGMAIVHLARDVRHGRLVALKMLRPELAASIGQEQFLAEIRLTARLAHPHVLPLLDSGMRDGEPFYVTPFVEGESLRARIRSGGALPIDEAVRLGTEIAEALDYAHRLGVVHRDIKPENILLADGHAIVADFGIAAAITASSTAGDGLRVVGSPAYISPEQARGDGSVDPRSDLYSLGCVLYELLAGEPPFRAPAAVELLSAHLSRPATSLLRHRPEIPPAIAAIVMQCLEKSPDARPVTAAAVIASLVLQPRIDAGATIRRTLARSMALYALIAVVVVGLARLSLDALSLPDWVLPAALVLVAAGVPAILLSEGVHYLTLRGEMRSAGIVGMAVRRLSRHTGRTVPAGAALAVAMLVLGVSGYVGARELGIGPAASLFSSGAMRRNDRILVADLEGSPADSLPLAALTAAIQIGLSEARHFKLLPPDAVAATLERMLRPRSTRLTPDVAREVAIREHVPIILVPQVSAVGGQYVVSLRLVATDSGSTLGVEQGTARSADELLTTIDGLTRKIRVKIGESFREVRALPVLAQVTTPSLAALGFYHSGVRANTVEGNYQKAVILLKKAVEIDSTFAVAWTNLAAAMTNASGASAERDSVLATAYRLRHRATTRERLSTEAYYYWAVQRDRVKGQAAYELILEMGDTVLATHLALIFRGQREFARAERMYKMVMAAEDTARATPLINLVEILFNLGKTREAEVALRTALDRFPGNRAAANAALTMRYLRGDLEGYGRGLDSASRADPGDMGSGLMPRRRYALLRGRRSEFNELGNAGRAPSLAKQVQPLSIPEAAHLAAYDVRVRRNRQSAVAVLDSALRGQPLASIPHADRRPYFPLAMAYALAGRPDRARDLVRQFEAAVTDTTLLRSVRPDMHTVQGRIALAEGRVDEAIASFRRGDIQDGKPVPCVGCLDIEIADAFDRAGNADSTLAALDRYVNRPWWARTFWDMTNLGRSYERLAQLHEARGNTALAIRYYTKLVELWKDADPDVQPRVRAARQRLQQLRAE